MARFDLQGSQPQFLEYKSSIIAGMRKTLLLISWSICAVFLLRGGGPDQFVLFLSLVLLSCPALAKSPASAVLASVGACSVASCLIALIAIGCIPLPKGTELLAQAGKEHYLEALLGMVKLMQVDMRWQATMHLLHSAAWWLLYQACFGLSSASATYRSVRMWLTLMATSTVLEVLMHRTYRRSLQRPQAARHAGDTSNDQRSPKKGEQLEGWRHIGTYSDKSGVHGVGEGPHADAGACSSSSSWGLSSSKASAVHSIPSQASAHTPSLEASWDAGQTAMAGSSSTSPLCIAPAPKPIEGSEEGCHLGSVLSGSGQRELPPSTSCLLHTSSAAVAVPAEPGACTSSLPAVVQPNGAPASIAEPCESVSEEVEQESDDGEHEARLLLAAMMDGPSDAYQHPQLQPEPEPQPDVVPIVVPLPLHIPGGARHLLTERELHQIEKDVEAHMVSALQSALNNGLLGTSEDEDDAEHFYSSPFMDYLNITIKLDSEEVWPEHMPPDTIDRIRELVLRLTGGRLLVLSGALRAGCVLISLDAVVLPAAMAVPPDEPAAGAGNDANDGDDEGKPPDDDHPDAGEGGAGRSGGGGGCGLLVKGDETEEEEEAGGAGHSMQGVAQCGGPLFVGDLLDSARSAAMWEEGMRRALGTHKAAAAHVSVQVQARRPQQAPASTPHARNDGPMQLLGLSPSLVEVMLEEEAGAAAPPKPRTVQLTVSLHAPAGCHSVSAYSSSRSGAHESAPELPALGVTGAAATDAAATATPPTRVLAVRMGRTYLSATLVSRQALSETAATAAAAAAGSEMSELVLEVTLPPSVRHCRPLVVELWAGGALVSTYPALLYLTSRQNLYGDAHWDAPQAGQRAEELRRLAASNASPRSCAALVRDLGTWAELLDEYVEKAAARSTLMARVRVGCASVEERAKLRGLSAWAANVVRQRPVVQQLVVTLTRFAVRNGMRTVAQDMLGASMSEAGRALLGGDHMLQVQPGEATLLTALAAKSGCVGLEADVRWWASSYAPAEERVRLGLGTGLQRVPGRADAGRMRPCMISPDHNKEREGVISISNEDLGSGALFDKSMAVAMPKDGPATAPAGGALGTLPLAVLPRAQLLPQIKAEAAPAAVVENVHRRAEGAGSDDCAGPRSSQGKAGIGKAAVGVARLHHLYAAAADMQPTQLQALALAHPAGAYMMVKASVLGFSPRGLEEAYAAYKASGAATSLAFILIYHTLMPITVWLKAAVQADECLAQPLTTAALHVSALMVSAVRLWRSRANSKVHMHTQRVAEQCILSMVCMYPLAPLLCAAGLVTPSKAVANELVAAFSTPVFFFIRPWVLTLGEQVRLPMRLLNDLAYAVSLTTYNRLAGNSLLAGMAHALVMGVLPPVLCCVWESFGRRSFLRTCSVGGAVATASSVGPHDAAAVAAGGGMPAGVEAVTTQAQPHASAATLATRVGGRL